jgi:hypothetical protein
MDMQIRNPTTAILAPVIARHCAGGSAGQCRQIGSAIDSSYEFVAPEHYGCGQFGPMGRCAADNTEILRQFALLTPLPGGRGGENDRHNRSGKVAKRTSSVTLMAAASRCMRPWSGRIVSRASPSMSCPPLTV